MKKIMLVGIVLLLLIGIIVYSSVQQSVMPGTTNSYVFNLTTNPANSNYSSGKYSVQYSNWAFMDSNNNILQKGPWTKITNGKFNKKIDLTLPTKVGDYILLGVITEKDYVFNVTNGVWKSGGYIIKSKKVIPINVKYDITPPPNNSLPTFSSILSNLFGWLKNIWSSIF